jgi:hypothetical protein
MSTNYVQVDVFPRRRNGVLHAQYGPGTCITTLDIQGPNTLIKFRDMQRWVPASELTPCPSQAVSPDPKTSRNSGWISGGYTADHKRDLRVKGGLLSRSAVVDIESHDDTAPRM